MRSLQGQHRAIRIWAKMKVWFVLSLSSLLLVGCASQGASGLATTSAVVVGGALAPAAAIYHGIAGVGRTLYTSEVYRIDDGIYAVSNDVGWFTDHSERTAKSGSSVSNSAWVIDLSRSEKDRKGRIILSETNLQRWFFRDTDMTKLLFVPRNPANPVGEYFTSELGGGYITLHSKDGAAHILLLKQD